MSFLWAISSRGEQLLQGWKIFGATAFVVGNAGASDLDADPLPWRLPNRSGLDGTTSALR
jgi:hypothetical protein